MTIFEFIKDQILHNQFASAAVIAAPATVLGYALRTVPSNLYRLVVRWSFVEVELTSSMEAYPDTISFLDQKVICKRYSRSFSPNDSEFMRKFYIMNTNAKTAVKVSLPIGFGKHIGFYKKRLTIVHRIMDKSENSHLHKERCTVSILTRGPDLVDSFSRDVTQFSERVVSDRNSLRIKITSRGEWTSKQRISPRMFDSVFIPEDIKNRIINHLERWQENQDWRQNKCMPTHTGILISGPPGTAKTSLVHVIASILQRSILLLNLSALDGESDFKELMSHTNQLSSGVLTIEDIDATTADIGSRGKSDRSDKSGISLSSLLNALDGVGTPPGMIVIGTTNHPEHIDPALLRPGRFDLHISLGKLERPEFDKMVQYFDMNPSDYTLDYFEPMTGAEVRMLLLEGGVGAVMEHQRLLRGRLAETHIDHNASD